MRFVYIIGMLLNFRRLPLSRQAASERAITAAGKQKNGAVLNRPVQKKPEQPARKGLAAPACACSSAGRGPETGPRIAFEVLAYDYQSGAYLQSLICHTLFRLYEHIRSFNFTARTWFRYTPFTIEK